MSICECFVTMRAAEWLFSVGKVFQQSISFRWSTCSQRVSIRKVLVTMGTAKLLYSVFYCGYHFSLSEGVYLKGISTRYFILVVNMLHSQRVSIRNILVTMSTAECLFSVTRCFILVIIMFHSSRVPIWEILVTTGTASNSISSCQDVSPLHSHWVSICECFVTMGATEWLFSITRYFILVVNIRAAENFQVSKAQTPFIFFILWTWCWSSCCALLELTLTAAPIATTNVTNQLIWRDMKESTLGITLTAAPIMTTTNQPVWRDLKESTFGITLTSVPIVTANVMNKSV